ncbi:MAG: peptide chain release factor N(5)-glutamine methyltransferase [Candidatus Omnitrophica bacterium]|nr:peptide chain release factor N(5)-glutamine methyltransferase [Candidatus Omnitrophota bacterium]
MSLPEQYVTGKAYFMDFELKVTPDTLIPRPETEILVEKAVDLIKEKGSSKVVRICDIGTGSGNIAISLAYYLKSVEIIAIDISEKALLIAEENAKKIGVSKKISFVKSDVFSVLDKNYKFDLIISNPPYVAQCHEHLLPPEVKAEPYNALLAGKDGMDVYKKICEDLKSYLKEDGIVMMEIGFDQSEKINTLLESKGFKDIIFFKDYSGIKRIVKAKNG